MSQITEISVSYDINQEGYYHSFGGQPLYHQRFRGLSGVFIFDGSARSIAKQNNGTFVLINKTGQVISEEYDGIYYLDRGESILDDEVLFAHRGDKWWSIDTEGKIIRQVRPADFPENSPLLVKYERSIEAQKILDQERRELSTKKKGRKSINLYLNNKQSIRISVLLVFVSLS
jgi:hypothetical protein